MFAKFSVFATVASLAAIANAQLQVLSPGGANLWWVAQSSNTLLWNCQQSQVQNFTIVLINSNSSILNGALPIVAIENNFDCSKTITQQQANLPVASNYKVQLANPLNSTDVYAESDFFDIKPLGSAYPDASATPTAGGSSTASGASSSGSSSPTSGSSSSDAISMKSSVAGLVGAAGVALAAMVL
ncbi:hypothetical protein SCHPADRAFT_848588 [Schizopora paradoxa]|uniref:Yeast cell wall synthesis Kre9/Knh1-like N-terminal domain-containing protein n=1 Tax=Schizopora paradoxa TaxID=27342 RepID=A0A0H2S326_9AGAM|nr:hypothetical protein SCHPADRAFT_848588 [Schizopora paradoxa]